MRIRSAQSTPEMAGKIPDPVYIQSDKFFNDPDNHQFFKDAGFDVLPVDVFGGFVPQDKSLANLKKAEKAIQDRFQLGKPK